MGRIIINNRSDWPDDQVVKAVSEVIRNGRNSRNGKQYCYLSSIGHKGNMIDIVSDLRKGSDSFTIINSSYRFK